MKRGNADGPERLSANRRASLAAPCGEDGDAADGRGGDATGRTTDVCCVGTAGGGETTRMRDIEADVEGARKLTNRTGAEAGEHDRGVGGVAADERSRKDGNCDGRLSSIGPYEPLFASR